MFHAFLVDVSCVEAPLLKFGVDCKPNACLGGIFVVISLGFGGALWALSWCGKEVVQEGAFVTRFLFGFVASPLPVLFLWFLGDFFVLGHPLLVVVGLLMWYTMRGIYGLLDLSYPCLSEVTLSPMVVEIWWKGLVWFLLAIADFGLSFRLLSCSIEVYIFPIEVGRWLEEAI